MRFRAASLIAASKISIHVARRHVIVREWVSEQPIQNRSVHRMAKMPATHVYFKNQGSRNKLRHAIGQRRMALSSISSAAKIKAPDELRL
jgi:hypothetical protein